MDGQDSEVLGMTSVDDELFVLLDQDSDQVAVYSINDYRPLTPLNLPELERHRYNDITSCVRQKCLYLSDFGSACILKYDLASAACTDRWNVERGTARSLSATLGGNVLATCWRRPDNELIELRATDGQIVRRVALQSGIAGAEYPAYGVQLSLRQFVVCLGFSHAYKVCVVEDAGRLAHSYGAKSHDSDPELCPYRLAVDTDSRSIFVSADDAVELLSPPLTYVHSFREKLSQPSGLYFDRSSRRLFVAQTGGDIAVIQL